jgi:hypothetical protein
MTARARGGPATSEALFEGHAARWQKRAGVTLGTMMGLPCLRVGGQFFASLDRQNGGLLVKLPAARVESEIAKEKGETFAPNGRVFREWLRVPQVGSRGWAAYLREAHRFVSEADRPGGGRSKASGNETSRSANRGSRS